MNISGIVGVQMIEQEISNTSACLVPFIGGIKILIKGLVYILSYS